MQAFKPASSSLHSSGARSLDMVISGAWNMLWKQARLSERMHAGQLVLNEVHFFVNPVGVVYMYAFSIRSMRGGWDLFSVIMLSMRHGSYTFSLTGGPEEMYVGHTT